MLIFISSGIGLLFVGISLGFIITKMQLRANLHDIDSLSMALIQSMGDGVVIIDGRGIISAANQLAQQLSDQPNELIGSSFFTTFAFFDRASKSIDSKVLANLATSQTPFIEIQRKGTQGLVEKYQMKVSPINRQKTLANSGYIVSLHDITHEKTIDQQRNEFISVVSHELRTPIAIVEGSISTIMNDKLIPYTPSQRKMIKTAYDKIIYLAEIVNNLNMVLQTENRTLDTNWKTVSPSDLMHRLLLLYQPIAKQKSISVSIDQLTNKQLLTDPQYLQEILTSFLSNAVEYTPAGGKVLLSSFEQKDGISFRVSDTGPGISPADQKMLFKKFFRTEDYHTKTTRGTGLSLYIAKQLSDRLGGKVWCESLIGHGSRFYVFIPFASAHSENQTEFIRAEVSEAIEGI